MNKEEFIKYFPLDEYQDESKKETWQKGELIYSKTDSSKQSDTWIVNNNISAGDYSISLKYANGKAGDNQHIGRTISLYIDGVKTQITLDPTTDWDTWGTFQKTFTLGTGLHIIKLSCDVGDTYNVNIDWLAVSSVGADLPQSIIKVAKSNIGAQ